MTRSPDMQELGYWLALLFTPGIGARQFRSLLNHYHYPKSVFESGLDSRALERSLSPDSINYLRRPDWKRIERELAWAEQPGHGIISLNDPQYPPLLKQIPDPPPLLFIEGHAGILGHPQLAMVGSRNPSGGGRHLAREFASQLAVAGFVITSGLATGIDAASHEGALVGKGLTVAVAGTGLDQTYPRQHDELRRQIAAQGVIVSEFPLGTPPLAHHFPRRNRIISGLSLGTLVVEAAPRSGSLITARLAAEQGREVFAIPGSVHNPLSRGCHELIRQGAKLTEHLDHILEELESLVSVALNEISPRPPIPSPGNDTPDIRCLFENMGFDPIAIDELVERSGLTPKTVSAMLVSLELQGRVTSSGGLYCRNDYSG